jgi:hypothetical protein
MRSLRFLHRTLHTMVLEIEAAATDFAPTLSIRKRNLHAVWISKRMPLGPDVHPSGDHVAPGDEQFTAVWLSNLHLIILCLTPATPAVHCCARWGERPNAVGVQGSTHLHKRSRPSYRQPHVPRHASGVQLGFGTRPAYGRNSRRSQRRIHPRLPSRVFQCECAAAQC